MRAVRLRARRVRMTPKEMKNFCPIERSWSQRMQASCEGLPYHSARSHASQACRQRLWTSPCHNRSYPSSFVSEHIDTTLAKVWQKTWSAWAGDCMDNLLFELGKMGRMHEQGVHPDKDFLLHQGGKGGHDLLLVSGYHADSLVFLHASQSAGSDQEAHFVVERAFFKDRKSV